ncbi:unnamed protein product [Discula destructiva]
MATMSSFGAGLARRGLLNEPAAALRCPACLRRPALPQSGRLSQVSSASGGGRRSYNSKQTPKRPRFSSRLRMALGKSKTEWYFIPVGVGIGFLGLIQGYKVYTREKALQEEEAQASKPKKRQRIRPDGPWQVQVMSTLPLKALSRLWGKFNEIDIPYYFRVPGFKLYSWVFGVNLDEVAEPDLHVYPNLAAFFYRTLKLGVRPLDPNPNALLSPSDGKVLQYGQIQGGDIEQVKGMTYSIDALLGKNTPPASIRSGTTTPLADDQSLPEAKGVQKDAEVVKQDEEFARVNGIPYTLPGLFSGENKDKKKKQGPSDQSTGASATSVSEVRADLALGERPWYDLLSEDHPTALYYAVIYLAPGDYHRFHSPTNWIVERRRHFAGELFSVSPYLQRTLPGLFTLNERVVLLGRWRWGFFSYIPVGATNVGSIKINFDRELRTNSLTTDTEADRAAEEAAARGEPYTGFSEATYEMASQVLQGHALRKGEEMGGFQLGSTIVLVFEAPLGKQDEQGRVVGGWNWQVEKGTKVKMGQALGCVDAA